MAEGNQDFSLTLYDYADEYQWIRMLGWSEEDLRKVPVHEEASSGEEYLNLANFGGTPLGVSAVAGGGTSGNVRAIRNLYVYKSEVPDNLWQKLADLANRGGPSAFEEDGQFGERGFRQDFPPRK